MKKTYNGWANRETWVVNLHFGDSIREMLDDDVEEGTITENSSYREIADRIEEIVDFLISDDLDDLIDSSPFLADMIDLSVIDYYDLAQTFESDLDYPEEEEE